MISPLQFFFFVFVMTFSYHYSKSKVCEMVPHIQEVGYREMRASGGLDSVRRLKVNLEAFLFWILLN